MKNFGSILALSTFLVHGDSGCAQSPPSPEGEIVRGLEELELEVVTARATSGAMEHSARSLFLTRYDALRREALRFASSWSTAAVGVCFNLLASCSGHLEIDVEASIGDLEFARRLILASPTPHHGASVVMNRLAERYHQLGRPALVTEWIELVAQWPDEPKRGWLAAEAGRSLMNFARVPAVAIEVLDRGIESTLRLAEWSEDSRRAIVNDSDLWITMPGRPLAGSRDDCLGQLYLLRGFARLENSNITLALDDLAVAREYLERTGNEHRLVNVQHNLAGVWLKLGRLDAALDVARAAREAYQTAVWSNVPDTNGVWAMQKVEARALVERGLPGDLQEARRMLEPMADSRFIDYPHQTNVDAFIVWIETLLAGDMPPDDISRFALFLGEIRKFCKPRGATDLLLEADLLEARWELRCSKPYDALRRLAAAREHIKEDLPLRIRHACLEGRAELAAGRPRESLRKFLLAGRAVHEAISQEKLWTFDLTVGAFQQTYTEALRGAVDAYRAIIAIDPAISPAALSELYEIVQQFHGYEAACSSMSKGGEVVAMPADVRKRFDRLQSRAELLQSQLAVRQRARPAPGFPALLHAEALRSSEREVQAVRDEVASLCALYRASSVAPTASSLAEVQAALLPGELLLECIDLEQSVAVLCIDRQSASLRELASGLELRSRLAQWSFVMANDTEDDDGGEATALRALSGLLIPKGGWLDERLSQCDSVLWSPEGDLCRVPFCALSWKDGLVVDRLATTHLASGTVLSDQRKRAGPLGALPTGSGGRLLAFGNPRYPATEVDRTRLRAVLSVGALQSLPSTAREVLSIAQQFASPEELSRLRAIKDPDHWDGEICGGRFRVLLGGHARESALNESALDGVRYLHFACHAFADIHTPALSYLALSLDESSIDADDGLLRLSEFTRLRGHYELLALSACDTGKGLVRGHEGPASLARAAFAAGAKRVVASLWQVRDDTTADLLVRFYRAWLAEGLSAAEALRTAQLEARRAMSVRDWAAFTLWGEPR